MRLTFLGTAASEGYPDAFCACANCGRARELGGPSLRMRSATLLDDALILDLGPDVMAASLVHGVSLAAVRWCLITHEHADHLDASHLSSRSPARGVVDAPRMELFATEGALRKAAAALCPHLSLDGLLDPEVRARLNLLELRPHFLEHLPEVLATTRDLVAMRPAQPTGSPLFRPARAA